MPTGTALRRDQYAILRHTPDHFTLQAATAAATTKAGYNGSGQLPWTRSWNVCQTNKKQRPPHDHEEHARPKRSGVTPQKADQPHEPSTNMGGVAMPTWLARKSPRKRSVHSRSPAGRTVEHRCPAVLEIHRSVGEKRRTR